MKKKLCLFSLLFLLLTSMVACGNGSFENGYAAGYDAGYQAAVNAAAATTAPQPTAPDIPSSDLIPQKEPETGHVFKEIPNDSFKSVAPLTIETTGAGGYYFVIDPLQLTPPSESESYSILAKVVARNSSVRMYVHAGDLAEVKVPLGEYDVYYAYGSTWYGEDDLFGPETTYFKCSDTFTFESTSNGIKGWTLSLVPTNNGNIQSHEIDKSNFPSPENN